MADARAERTACLRCGLAAGNSRGIAVNWHMLQRTIYDADWKANGRTSPRLSVRTGSIPICDRCIDEGGRPSAKLKEIRMLEHVRAQKARRA